MEYFEVFLNLSKIPPIYLTPINFNNIQTKNIGNSINNGIKNDTPDKDYIENI